MTGFGGSLRVVDRPTKKFIVICFSSDFAGLLINMGKAFFKAVDVLVVEDVFASLRFVFIRFISDGFIGI